jgi:hypothetical protein
MKRMVWGNVFVKKCPFDIVSGRSIFGKIRSDIFLKVWFICRSFGAMGLIGLTYL